MSDNKMSDNNLTTELVKNKTFFKPITIDKIVIFNFMISGLMPSSIALIFHKVHVHSWLPLILAAFVIITPDENFREQRKQ